MKVHRSLKVWQKAIDLTVQVYALSEKFPRGCNGGGTEETRSQRLRLNSDRPESPGEIIGFLSGGG